MSEDREAIEALSKFSVLNTGFCFKYIDGKTFVDKTILPNVALPISCAELKRMIDDYYGSIQGAGIPIPAVRESSAMGPSVRYLCEYAGENLVQRFPAGLESDAGRAVLRCVAAVFRSAIEAAVSIDPHPKNFVISGGRVWFVDFSPPYTREYERVRLSVAAADEVALIRTNFECFRPHNLCYHFVGDFFNVEPAISEVRLRAMHREFVESGLVAGDYEAFVARAREIRSIEDARLARRIFLL